MDSHNQPLLHRNCYKSPEHLKHKYTATDYQYLPTKSKITYKCYQIFPGNDFQKQGFETPMEKSGTYYYNPNLYCYPIIQHYHILLYYLQNKQPDHLTNTGRNNPRDIALLFEQVKNSHSRDRSANFLSTTKPGIIFFSKESQMFIGKENRDELIIYSFTKLMRY